MDVGGDDQDISIPARLHLLSAFLAMEPPNALLSLARDCGGGLISESVQSFIWHHCVRKYDGRCHMPYVQSFLKKLILEVESKGGVVLDQLYEQYTYYMTSIREDDWARKNSRVLKTISFIFPEEYAGLISCPKTRKLEVPLNCSLNMLEGDTGCCVWPSSLFLSEFILSFPEMFSNKSCIEVGSGAGLVGICLRHVKASPVILTDGDLSTLSNLKINVELNHLTIMTDLSDASLDADKVTCIHLPWEYASEKELRSFSPHIVLGADVIYDPLCLPHLVRILAVLLEHENSAPCFGLEVSECSSSDNLNCESGVWCGDIAFNNTLTKELLSDPLRKRPIALIASVIRNSETFSYFLSLAEQANLLVIDITEKMKPIHFLPYMKSYQRTSVKMFVLSHIC